MNLESANQYFQASQYPKALELYLSLFENGNKEIEVILGIIRSSVSCNKNISNNFVDLAVEYFMNSENYFMAQEIMNLTMRVNQPLLSLYEKLIEHSRLNGNVRELKKVRLNLLNYLYKTKNYSLLYERYEKEVASRRLMPQEYIVILKALYEQNDVCKFETIFVEYINRSGKEKNEIKEKTNTVINAIAKTIDKNRKAFEAVNIFIQVLNDTQRSYSNILKAFILYHSNFDFISILKKHKIIDGPVVDEYLKQLDFKKFSQLYHKNKNERRVQDNFEPPQLIQTISPTQDKPRRSSFKKELVKLESNNIDKDYLRELEKYILSDKCEIDHLHIMQYLISSNLTSLIQKYFLFVQKAITKEQYIEIAYLYAEYLLSIGNYNTCLDLNYELIERVQLSKEEEVSFLYLIAEAYYQKSEFKKSYKYFRKIQTYVKDYRLLNERMRKIEKLK